MIKRTLISFLGLLCIAQSAMAANGFWSNHALLYIFSSKCPYCQKMAPVIQQYARNNQIPVKAYSVDGYGLPGFSEFSHASSQLLQAAYAGGQITYPASFVMNTSTYQIFPLGIGAMDYNQFSSRLTRLLPQVAGYEGGNYAR